MPVKAAGAQRGYLARVVYMSVGQKHRIDLTGQHRQIGVFVNILSLLHTTVNHNRSAARLDKRTRAGNLMRGTVKHYFQTITPFLL